MKTNSIWQEVTLPRFSPLGQSIKVDVVVVGGGIFGLSAAYLLRRAGKTVCLLERDTLASGDTSNTTAHLTYVTDVWLSDLVKQFGREKAQLTWRAGMEALRLIEEIVNTESIDCDFQKLPGFLYRASEDSKTKEEFFKEEAELIKELGFDAEYLANVPIFGNEGICIPDQAAFHPLKYLSGLAEILRKDAGCHIFEQSEAEEFKEEPLSAQANGHWVTGDQLIVATHVPLVGTAGVLGAAVFQTKIASYSSYAIAATLHTSHEAKNGLYWDSLDPYNYTRVNTVNSTHTVILGGEDHKTGQVEETEECFEKLEERLSAQFPESSLEFRWSGQVVETHDGLPFIGETSEQQFIGTGFSGNGMTFGTLAAIMACDFVLKHDSPWKELFAADRKPLGSSTLEYLRENIDYPYYLIKDFFKFPPKRDAKEIRRGSGQVIKENGKRIACYCSDSGETIRLTAICPHMGCTVHWNDAENTWDCPCHGSRFACDGALIAGPAETGLSREDP